MSGWDAAEGLSPGYAELAFRLLALDLSHEPELASRARKRLVAFCLALGGSSRAASWLWTRRGSGRSLAEWAKQLAESSRQPAGQELGAAMVGISSGILLDRSALSFCSADIDEENAALISAKPGRRALWCHESRRRLGELASDPNGALKWGSSKKAAPLSWGRDFAKRALDVKEWKEAWAESRCLLESMEIGFSLASESRASGKASRSRL